MEKDKRKLSSYAQGHCVTQQIPLGDENYLYTKKTLPESRCVGADTRLAPLLRVVANVLLKPLVRVLLRVRQCSETLKYDIIS